MKKPRPVFSFGGGKEMDGKNTKACLTLAQEIQDTHRLLCEGGFSDEEKVGVTSELRKEAKKVKLIVKKPDWFAKLFV